MRSSFIHRLSPAIAALLALGVGVGLQPSALNAAAPPAHLHWATSVAYNVTPENNAYGVSPTFLTWPGVGGATTYTNRSECSPFVTRVLKQAYGWSSTYFTTWMGASSPNSATYHDTIVAGYRWTRITQVSEIAPGDLLAAKYLAPEPGTTGHTMIAVSAAVARTASKPLVAGTTQWELTVVDSSKSGHGATDTRRRADGTFEDGVGVGVLRLYADAAGNVVGYSWSTLSGSTFYDATSRPLAIGRL